MQNSIRILLGLFLIILIANCGQTVESQRKRWSYNQDRLELVEQQFPNFSELISKIKSEGEQIYESAGDITDEEAKIDRMGEANDVISPPFVSGLFDFDKKAEEARDLVEKLVKNSKDKDAALLAATSGISIERYIADAREQLRNANPTNVLDANRIVRAACEPINKSIEEMKKIQQELSKPEKDTESGEAPQ